MYTSKSTVRNLLAVIQQFLREVDLQIEMKQNYSVGEKVVQ